MAHDTTPIFIGREKEKEILNEALQSAEAEMVAVIGRRRVGKTFLVRRVYENDFIFEITGLQNATVEKQLDHFNFTLSKYVQSDIPVEKASSWLDAFRILTLVLKQKLEASKGKKVIFFDELPWLAKNESGFLTGLDFFGTVGHRAKMLCW